MSSVARRKLREQLQEVTGGFPRPGVTTIYLLAKEIVQLFVVRSPKVLDGRRVELGVLLHDGLHDDGGLEDLRHDLPQSLLRTIETAQHVLAPQNEWVLGPQAIKKVCSNGQCKELANTILVLFSTP